MDLAVAEMDLSRLSHVAIDETSCESGHSYITLATDMQKRQVVFVTKGRSSQTIAEFARHLEQHQASPKQIESVSIDMPPAFIKGVAEQLPNARVTFDKFHVIAHASAAVDKIRRMEQKTAPDLKGMRWSLIRDRCKLNTEQRIDLDLDTLIAQYTTKRTARAWLYKEQLRDILDRKQINIVSSMLKQWCNNVMRSKVEPMKAVATMIRSHFDDIVSWSQTRQTNGFIEAINGLFQAAKRQARQGNISALNPCEW